MEFLSNVLNLFRSKEKIDELRTVHLRESYLEKHAADYQNLAQELEKAARNIKEGPQDDPQLDFSRFVYKMEYSKEVGRNKCLERYFDDLQYTPDYIKAITPFAKKTTEPVKKTNRDLII